MAFGKCMLCVFSLVWLISHRTCIGTETSDTVHGHGLVTQNVINNDQSSSKFPADYNPKVYAFVGTLLVGLTGVFPLLVISVETGQKLSEGVSADRLKLLLGFAVGALLGDVFLHLLPEAIALSNSESVHKDAVNIGIWVLGGLLTFLILEKVFQQKDTLKTENEQAEKSKIKEDPQIHDQTCNGESRVANGYTRKNHDDDIRKRILCNSNDIGGSKTHSYKEKTPVIEVGNIQVEGYLNLFANCVDNFTHGLAVSGSFLVSQKVGLLTTFAILLHEIPHEIGDFAILLRAGLRRKDAAFGQLCTAAGGLIGAAVGLFSNGTQCGVSFILPFTSGGFIYIALVTIIPDLLEEQRPWESFKQLVSLIAGITSMGLVSLIH